MSSEAGQIDYVDNAPRKMPTIDLLASFAIRFDEFHELYSTTRDSSIFRTKCMQLGEVIVEGERYCNDWYKYKDDIANKLKIFGMELNALDESEGRFSLGSERVGYGQNLQRDMNMFWLIVDGIIKKEYFSGNDSVDLEVTEK